MKLSKSLIVAALGLACASFVNAQTVYITGSTAFRGNIFNVLTTPGIVFDGTITTTTWGNTTGSKGNYMVFSGTPHGGSGTLTIQCAWSGSDAGISDVAPQSPAATENFSADAQDGTVHSSNPSTFTSHTVDLAMADNEQAFASIYGNNAGTVPAKINNEAKVGVVTFKWVRNPGVWTGNNVSSSMIRQALTGFGARQSVFDGNSASTKWVYVSGRNLGSGTRVNAFGDTQFGIFNGPNQVEINSSGAMVQDTDVNGTLGYIGDMGFSSGGSLAGTMGGNTVSSTDQVQTGTGFSVIAYLGFDDAASAVGKGATELSYNGVSYSVSGIENGTYTFWGYEYILENNSAVAPATTVYAQLKAATGIPSTLFGATGVTSSNGMQLGLMQTSRSGPTGDPSHN